MSYTQSEAQQILRDELKPGSTVHTILRHVSRSGMSRSISVLVNGKQGPRDISWLVAQATDFKFDRKNDGLKVGGCGMDMGFHLVYTLGRVLYPKGYRCSGEGKRTGRKCQSNDHSNPPYPSRKGCKMRHTDGGYAFNHRWI